VAATDSELDLLRAVFNGIDKLNVDSSGSSPPTGSATEAKQDVGNTSLSSIDGKVATEAKQDTGNTSVASIDTKTPALVSGRVPVDGSGVTQPVSGTVTANAGTGTFVVTPAADVMATGITFTANGQTSGPFPVEAGYPTAAFQAAGTWTGTIVLERTIDGSNWENIPSCSGTDVVNSITANGIFVFPIGAAQQIRFRTTAWTSGTANCSAAKSLGLQVVRLASSLPTGINTIGIIDQGVGGASAWKVDGSAVTQPVSVVSLPLPTGAATEAKQDVGNTSLASIDSKLSSDTSSVTSVNATATSTQLLATNSSRKGFSLFNDADKACFVLFSGGTASSTNFSVKIGGGAFYDTPAVHNYRGAIQGIWEAGPSGAMKITEYT